MSDADRTVCFCFGHTVANVAAGARDDGSNAVVESITDACRRGLGRCAERNPSGHCCLGEIRALVHAPARSCCEEKT